MRSASPPVSSAPPETNTDVLTRQEAISQCSENRTANTYPALAREMFTRRGEVSMSCVLLFRREVTRMRHTGLQSTRSRSRVRDVASRGSEAGETRILANPENSLAR